MSKTKVLFLIHDLGGGGAENVLVNLVNHMDCQRFEITVMALFGGGVNEQRLAPHVRLKTAFRHPIPGNSRLLRLLTPAQLHRLFVREHYDAEVAYLEGPSTRIIAGCQDPSARLFAWVHCTAQTARSLSGSFRSQREAARCYARFHAVCCVSQNVLDHYRRWFSLPERAEVVYNTVDSDAILEQMQQSVELPFYRRDQLRICGVGKLTQLKGFDRLARIHQRLVREGYPVHTYILGTGEDETKLRSWAKENGLEDSFTLLGYQKNPYQYVSRCDLFVCASHSEGFSTAATEALIVGTPVCTVEVSGMREMLGEHDEYGIVTENDDEALYQAIKRLLDDPALLEHYRRQAQLRGKRFSTKMTVQAVEDLLLEGA